MCAGDDAHVNIVAGNALAGVSEETVEGEAFHLLFQNATVQKLNSNSALKGAIDIPTATFTVFPPIQTDFQSVKQL